MVWPNSTHRDGLATVNIWRWHGHILYVMFGWSGHSQCIGMVWAQSIYRDGLGYSQYKGMVWPQSIYRDGLATVNIKEMVMATVNI